MQTRIIYVEQCEQSKKSAEILKERTLEYFDNVELLAGTWKDDINVADYNLADNIFGGQKGSEGKLSISAEVATYLSHRSAWNECAESNEYMLILEDDAHWDKLPDVKNILNFKGEVLNLGIPNWGTPIGRQSKSIKQTTMLERRKVCGYNHDMHDYANSECTCDNVNLFGAHAYVISPVAAQKLVEANDVIYPADVFIRQELVTIYDLYPLIVSQKSYSGDFFSNIVNKDYV